GHRHRQRRRGGLPVTAREVLVLGGGPAGLSTAALLRRRGRDVLAVERDAAVGGLCRTIRDGGFRFDLGGHRFYSKNADVHAFFADVIGDDLIEVGRRSSIHFRSRYIDYPIKPWNALRHVGPFTAARIGLDLARLSLPRRPRPPRSLEDWMRQHYGRTLYETFFKVYAEKVWGLRADAIDAGLAAQRVKGLDLWATLKNAVFRRTTSAVESMVERFHYPRFGYGQFCDNLAAELLPSGSVACATEPVRIRHDGARVLEVELRGPGGGGTIRPEQLVSSIPVTSLLRLLEPAPPLEVQRAAAGLGFRAVVFVAVFVDRPSVRPESWIYFPSPQISFGRVTEPRNWSSDMAPAGQTSIIAEHFCNAGDATWQADDAVLAERTITDLDQRLGLLRRKEVLGTKVVRAAAAYPRMDTGHRDRLAVIEAWLDRLDNLQAVGRSGMYRYHNTDHVIETAFACVDRLSGGAADPRSVNTELSYHEEKRTA
ncbi:MAG: FAD-dependent oxidoreductase, partial [Planctomycetes bacterium]|nr:FAD-dependent oxidoreductase [Planctomycetota bacterium]